MSAALIWLLVCLWPVCANASGDAIMLTASIASAVPAIIRGGIENGIESLLSPAFAADLKRFVTPHVTLRCAFGLGQERQSFDLTRTQALDHDGQSMYFGLA
jgi:hypothetical protein